MLRTPPSSLRGHAHEDLQESRLLRDQFAKYGVLPEANRIRMAFSTSNSPHFAANNDTSVPAMLFLAPMSFHGEIHEGIDHSIAHFERVARLKKLDGNPEAGQPLLFL